MDHYLRGIDTGRDHEAPVRIFVMGDNAWRDEPAWPLPATVPVGPFPELERRAGGAWGAVGVAASGGI